MAQLKSFKDIESKSKSFSNKEFIKIDTKEEFDNWFIQQTTAQKEERKTDFIFRGMDNAKYKLYTSAQRQWIENDMKEWTKKKYLDFVYEMIQKAKDAPLIKKVFDMYCYDDYERDFPILSILQHYTAPTPLMDWSYNINVALFFATDKISGGNGKEEIDDYFSIYQIDKSNYKGQFRNIRDWADSVFPSFEKIKQERENAASTQEDIIFYVSDFDSGNSDNVPARKEIRILPDKAATSIYNQNIIPQEGLFIFNPSSRKTIDDIFEKKISSDVGQVLSPFACFNIKKDLAEYVRRHIKKMYSIDKSFIYPHLYDDTEKIRNEVLNLYA